jgi:lambda repressor-like predicted transcriptional regulator
MLLQGLTVTGSELASEIKKVGLATSTLVTLVRVSDRKSRDEIAQVLSDFVEKSRKIGIELQKSR